MSIYLESLCWMEFLPKFNSPGGGGGGWVGGLGIRMLAAGGDVY